ncbi:hypothetical protein ACI2L1_00560 [Streptomyces sp. NPDC019531]|uniref:hypothetical protein n=1 Tax=Streptomyces sp. NPDC019531 TaxID=3365062 RepID=UPI00384DE143
MSGRRRLLRWALLVWAALVVVAGGLRLWLQDSAQPSGPYGWEESSPSPTLPEERRTMCPSPTTDPDGDRTIVACAFISG